MEPFDSTEKIRQVFEAFQITDAIFSRFRRAFYNAIHTIVADVHPAALANESVDQLIEQYANQTLNTIQSVLEKDNNYSDFRQQEELTAFEQLLNKSHQNTDVLELALSTHSKSKQLIADYFPVIHNLSSFGFRLLEKNTRLDNITFVELILFKE